MVKKDNKKRKFKGGVSRNAAKQQKGAQYGHLNLPKGISVFKEEPKTRVNIDILPYEVTDQNHPDRDDEYNTAVPGELWYKRPYHLHRNIGPNNENMVCPTSINQPCPICEYKAQMLKEGADWQDDSIKALKASKRNLYVIIPKGNKDYEEKIHLWDISQFLFQDKLNEEGQENEEYYEIFPDLEEGYTLQIRFSEEQLGANKFADTSRIDFVERKKQYNESILEDVPNLDEVLSIQSYKAIESMFFGGMSEEEVEEEVTEIVDEDAPFDEEEEQEEEEKPKKEVKKEPKKDTSKKGKGKKNECPYGYKFGVDIDEHDECEDCEKWEDCMDASE